jgi:thiol-disulfide isomerase/thioredoxin
VTSRHPAPSTANDKLMTKRIALASALVCALAAGAARADARIEEPLWYSRPADAFGAAKKSQKPLMVDLYADWCGWCKVMEAKVFSTPEFGRLAADYVLLRVDVEDGGEGGELAARYDSSQLPTLLVLEPSGALVGEIRGYKPVADLVAETKRVHAIHAKVLASYEKLIGSSDADALRAAAGDFYRRRDGARAATLFARLVAVDPSQGDDAAWLRFFLADSLRRAERYAEAAEAARAAAPLAAAVGDRELAERLELLPFWIAKDAARCADASGALQSFERGHPESVFLPGAKRALAELRAGRSTCS